MKKHQLEIDVDKLPELRIKPPRRRLWDFLPARLCLWYMRLTGHNPKSTPYEEWVLKNAFLRVQFSRYRAALTLLNLNSAEYGDVKANAPGSNEVN